MSTITDADLYWLRDAANSICGQSGNTTHQKHLNALADKLDSLRALAAAPVSLEALIAEIDGRFRSGNSIAVDRIWLTAGVWGRIRDELAALQPAGVEWQEAVVEACMRIEGGYKASDPRASLRAIEDWWYQLGVETTANGILGSQAIEAMLAASPQQEAAPARDWVMVPREMTDAMIAPWLTPEQLAGGKSGGDLSPHAAVVRKYNRMLAAAPTPTDESGHPPEPPACGDEELAEVISDLRDIAKHEGWLVCGVAADLLAAMKGDKA